MNDVGNAQQLMEKFNNNKNQNAIQIVDLKRQLDFTSFPFKGGVTVAFQ